VSYLWIDVIIASKRCSPEEGEGGDRNQKFGGFGGEFRRGCGHRATTEGEGCFWRVLLGRSGRAREKCSMWHQRSLNRGLERDGEVGGLPHGVEQREQGLAGGACARFCQRRQGPGHGGGGWAAAYGARRQGIE
jgi:hypothetical protein